MGEGGLVGGPPSDGSVGRGDSTGDLPRRLTVGGREVSSKGTFAVPADSAATLAAKGRPIHEATSWIGMSFGHLLKRGYEMDIDETLYMRLQDRGDPEPWGVVAFNSTVGMAMWYPNAGWFDNPEFLAPYFFKGESGGWPIGREEAAALIRKGVGPKGPFGNGVRVPDDKAASLPKPGPDGDVDTVKAANLNEDWLRTMSWDIRLPNGSLCMTLNDVAYALGVDKHTAARRILTLPFGEAAPAAVTIEAQSLIDADPTREIT